MRFRDAYASAAPAAEAFLTPTFLDLTSRKESVAAACGRLDPRVAEAIRAQNVGAAPSAERQAALAALDGDLSVVVTGQQLGLFGGPLYALHKAAAAVRLAQRLQAESGRPVVPIFWLQAEDHDFDEIAHHTLVRRDGRLDHTGVTSAAPERAAVAHRKLGADVVEALDAVDVAGAELPHGSAVFEWLRERWQPERTWVDAFASTVLGWFADTGLLVLNPRTPELAALAAPVHRWALAERASIGQTLAERAAALEAAGFGAQVPIRPDCALSFIHPEDPAGDRFRLRAHGDAWTPAGAAGRLTQATLDAWLTDAPLRFSTSAMLRPVLQDTLLPTAAYVGGPSEVAYFAQIAPLYALRGQRLPMIVPRPAWRWVPPFVGDDLARDGLAPSDMDEGVDAALRRGSGSDASDPPGDEAVARVLAAVDAALTDVADDLSHLGPSIERARQKTRKTVGRYVHRFGKNVDRAHARADAARVERIERASAWLCPDGHFAERKLGFAPLAGIVGIEALVQRALAVADPLDPPPPDVWL